MRIHKTLFFFLLLSYFGLAQNKLEKESRISINDVPEQAKQFVFKLTPSKKVKWYKETGFNTETIEAKTKYKKQKYSIEFSNNGSIEDIEIQCPFNDINAKIKPTITTQITKLFTKHKIKKVQKQYIGTSKNLLNYFKTGVKNNISINYEIVLKGKNHDGKKLYELLFLENGTLKKTSVIVFRNTDNIEF